MQEPLPRLDRREPHVALAAKILAFAKGTFGQTRYLLPR